jgi:predicted N-acetyltransferase YhbS
MSFRVAVEADADALRKLINAAFVVEKVAIEGDRIDDARLRDFFRNGTFLLLEEGARLSGCVYVEKRGERGYLGLLSVDPALQQKGLGRKLTAEAEAHLRRAGCRAVDLRVISARPELVPIYRKLGYVENGTSAIPPEVPLKVACHFVHMAKTLD